MTGPSGPSATGPVVHPAACTPGGYRSSRPLTQSSTGCRAVTSEIRYVGRTHRVVTVSEPDCRSSSTLPPAGLALSNQAPSRSAVRAAVGGTASAQVVVDADRAQGQHRAEGGGGRLVALALAAALQPGPVEGLRLGVTGEQPEADRHTGVEGHPVEPVCGRTAHVVEVGGATADHDTECDDGVVPGPGAGLCDERELEGARDADDVEASDLVGAQRFVGSRQEAVHHLLVPARGDDGDLDVAAVDGLVGGTSGATHWAAPSVWSSSPSSWWPIRSRLVNRHCRLWSLGRGVMATRSVTGTPYDSRLEVLSGLLVSSRTDATPRSRRTWVAAP